MALLLNASNLTKSFGAEPLFREVSLTVSEGDRLGLVGPNGSGKSTLLQILAGIQDPDTGSVAVRKGTRVTYVAQDSTFAAGVTISEVIRSALRTAGVPEAEWQAREAETLGRAGFTDFQTEAATLSGGWRKRLAIAAGIASSPDLVLLDEPTNHLDLEAIAWLEALIRNSRSACVLISHDRYFLENVATDMAELNRIYPGGMFRVQGHYSTFLEQKSNFLAAQARRQQALENRVRTEIEWLRRGPKARATKAKARIDKAQELISDLNDLETRTRTATVGLDFNATDRKTKRLIELKSVSYRFGDRPVISGVSVTLTPGLRIGLVGPNGSGKTTILRLVRGEIEPESGEITRANGLRTVYFSQQRNLDPAVTLRRTLAPDSDSVVYQDRSIHVASWADRFLFTNEQLNQPVGRLSGGERARVTIAKLMLEPADVLLLDEPTNDLDIPTLAVLEESLVEFPGALVLVTHDRYMLDRVSTAVLGLNGRGQAAAFASYSQWETWVSETAEEKSPASVPRPPAQNTTPKKKLSYLDSREYATIEERIASAEAVLSERRGLLQDPEVTRDPGRLQDVLRESEEAQQAVDELYSRWAELEAKLS